MRGHHRRLLVSRRYAEGRSDDGRRVLVHRLRAEKALGRGLPVGAVVHHADGSKSVHSPLVICQSEAYHQLLHRRTRVLKAGGNPNTDRICSRCHAVKPLEQFHADKTNRMGRVQYCKPCRNKYESQRRLERLCRA